MTSWVKIEISSSGRVYIITKLLHKFSKAQISWESQKRAVSFLYFQFGSKYSQLQVQGLRLHVCVCDLPSD